MLIYLFVCLVIFIGLSNIFWVTFYTPLVIFIVFWTLWMIHWKYRYFLSYFKSVELCSWEQINLPSNQLLCVCVHVSACAHWRGFIWSHVPPKEQRYCYNNFWSSFSVCLLLDWHPAHINLSFFSSPKLRSLIYKFSEITKMYLVSTPLHCVPG